MSEDVRTKELCPSCGEHAATFRQEDRQFKFENEGGATTLSARIPVGECANCGLEFVDKVARRIQHEAICTHLGLTPPSKIEAIRKQWGMSRQRFAEVTKIGEASLSRWERGVGFQNPALDQLLYLLSFADNLGRLEKRDEKRSNIIRFDHIKNRQETNEEARHFRLCKVG